MTKSKDPKGKNRLERKDNPNTTELTQENLRSLQKINPNQPQDPETESIAASVNPSIAPSISDSIAATIATQNTMVGTLSRANEIKAEFAEILGIEFGDIEYSEISLRHKQLISNLQFNSSLSSSKEKNKRLVNFFRVRNSEIAIPDLYLFYLTKKLQEIADQGDYELLINNSRELNKESFINLEQQGNWIKALRMALFYNDPKDYPLFHFRYLNNFDNEAKDAVLAYLAKADTDMTKETITYLGITNEIDRQAKFLIDFMKKNTNEQQLQAFARKYQLICYYLEERRIEDPQSRFIDLQRQLRQEQEQKQDPQSQEQSTSSSSAPKKQAKVIVLTKPKDSASKLDQDPTDLLVKSQAKAEASSTGDSNGADDKKAKAITSTIKLGEKELKKIEVIEKSEAKARLAIENEESQAKAKIERQSEKELKEAQKKQAIEFKENKKNKKESNEKEEQKKHKKEKNNKQHKKEK